MYRGNSLGGEVRVHSPLLEIFVSSSPVLLCRWIDELRLAIERSVDKRSAVWFGAPLSLSFREAPTMRRLHPSLQLFWVGFDASVNKR